jgi:glycerate dehydrogenase
MKITFLDALTLGNANLQNFNHLGEVKIHQTTSKEQTLSRIKNSDIIMTNKVVIDKEIMDNSNIKMIQILATGMNNVDLEYAQQKGIVVKNVAGYSTNSVVQTTFALVLSILNKTYYYDNYSKNKYSSSDIFTHIQDFWELSGKTWGIIGLGEIGRNVAKVAEAFGCQVQYYSTSGKNSTTDFKRVELKELLKTSKIISIHSPLNSDTLNLLNKDNLHLINENSILINMGRGGIVNENDLKEIMKEKNFYAGFDVFTKEPIEKDSPLLDIKNISFTPHIAWASLEAREKLIKLAYENVEEFIKNES